jgi:hypothetical protein
MSSVLPFHTIADCVHNPGFSCCEIKIINKIFIYIFIIHVNMFIPYLIIQYLIVTKYPHDVSGGLRCFV